MASACRQQVVVYECDDASHSPVDGGPVDRDAGEDAGLDAAQDAGSLDGEAPDTGELDAGGCDPFCFTAVQVSQDRVNVGEVATLTPVVEAAAGVQWTTRVDPMEVVAQRPPQRPAFAASDAVIQLQLSGTTQAGFVVQDVVPWFFETRFAIRVHVREVGRAFELSQTVEVVVRGNVLMSGGTEGRVYGLGSDGRPATGGGRFSGGILLSQLVEAPRAMVLGKDGQLLVHDDTPPSARIKRFELTGPDILAGALDYQDGNQDSLFRNGSPTYGFTQLPDGSTVFPEYSFAGPSNDPKSVLIVWNTAGQLDRKVWAPSPNEEWRSAVTDPDGKVLVVDRAQQIVARYDPATWLPDGIIVDQLSGPPSALFAGEDALYIGGFNFITEASWTTGGRAAISGLPGSSSSWRSITSMGGGRLLAARDTQSDTQNIAIIEGRQFQGWFRQPGGPVLQPISLVYLR